MPRPGFEPGITGSKGLPGGLSNVLRFDEYSFFFLPFYDWLLNVRRISGDTARDYLRQLRYPYDPSNRTRVKAYRLFIKFLDFNGVKEFTGYLRYMRVPRAGIDLYVPDEETVLNSLRRARNRNIRLVYLLLLSSGLRLVEVYNILKSFDKRRLYHYDNFSRYPLYWERGMKKSYWCYIINDILPLLRRIEVSRHWITTYTRRHNLVRSKYVRKFVATKMFELEIPSEVIDFYQGRVPRNIIAQHYLKMVVLGDRYYGRYAEWLSRFLKDILP